MKITEQAQALNETISEHSSSILSLLSAKGKASYFPKAGILAQAAEAADCEVNATIGVALEDNGDLATLPSISSNIKITDKEAFAYAPSAGVPELREKWQEMMIEKNPTCDGKIISLPVVTAALTHGISVSASLFVEPGEKVIAPDYFWGNYKLILENGVGAEIESYETFNSEGGYNIAGLAEKLAADGVGAKKVILNFPNNPTGYTPTKDEAEELKNCLVAEAEKGSTIAVIIDDAYFGLVFREGVYEESLFSKLMDAHENILAIKVDGPTKEDYVWGFRTGFITFGIKGGDNKLYKALEEKTAGGVRGSISNAPAISQNLLLNAFKNKHYKKEKLVKNKLLKTRFDTVDKIIKSHPEFAEQFVPMPYNSGYFMCIKLREELDPVVIRKELVKQEVGLIQVANLLRVSFASTPTKQLERVFTTIYDVAKNYKEPEEIKLDIEF
jgi:aspartate/methionine/tyrosine aminotransferase